MTLTDEAGRTGQGEIAPLPGLHRETLEQARVQIVKESYEWNVTLGAALFEFRNVRLPKTAATEQGGGNSEEETEGMILERVFLFEELVRIINDLFRLFLQVRLSEGWQAELQSIRGWVHAAGQEA